MTEKYLCSGRKIPFFGKAIVAQQAHAHYLAAFPMSRWGADAEGCLADRNQWVLGGPFSTHPLLIILINRLYKVALE